MVLGKALFTHHRKDHTLAKNYSIAIMRIKSVGTFAVLSGRGTRLDFVPPGELPAIGDSQFSHSFPLLARVPLTQLRTDRNICSVL